MSAAAGPPPLRVGLVGYGLAGEVFHAALVAACPDLALVGVVTRNPERAARVTRDHPAAAALPDTAALLGDLPGGPPDIVVVASPNVDHARSARAALDAGAAVVVDKPLALTSTQARELVARAAALGRLLTVFQNRRWDADQLTLARLLAEGTLGTVLRHESRFERWRPTLTPGKWREEQPAARGGGLLLDLGSHLVDQAVQLLGPVTAVYGEVAARRGGAEDDAFAALHHASGALSHLWVGALAGAPGPRRRVLGTAGAYVVAGLDEQEAQLRAGTRPSDAAYGTVPRSAWGGLHRGEDVVPVPSERGHWDAFYPAVAAAVREGTPPPVDPLDAVGVLGVLEAWRASAVAGQVMPVPVAAR